MKLIGLLTFFVYTFSFFSYGSESGKQSQSEPNDALVIQNALNILNSGDFGDLPPLATNEKQLSEQQEKLENLKLKYKNQQKLLRTQTSRLDEQQKLLNALQSNLLKNEIYDIQKQQALLPSVEEHKKRVLQMEETDKCLAQAKNFNNNSEALFKNFEDKVKATAEQQTKKQSDLANMQSQLEELKNKIALNMILLLMKDELLQRNIYGYIDKIQRKQIETTTELFSLKRTLDNLFIINIFLATAFLYCLGHIIKSNGLRNVF